MPRFNKNNEKELKKFLYNNYIHDSKLEKFYYDCNEDSIQIELWNPIFGGQINLAFFDISIVLARKGDWIGDRTTILSLTVEEDFSQLQNSNLDNNEYKENSLYLMFQTFSGAELHIVSKEVLADIIVKEDG